MISHLKMRLLFLKYILDQEEESILQKFLKLLFKDPVRRDWASTCMNDIKELKLTLSLEEIKSIMTQEF
jgi:hypothetical protein